MYTYDTETSYNGEMVWIWSWALCDEDLHTVDGDGTTALSALTDLPDCSEVWIHNLAFDGEALFYLLIEQGYSLSYELNPRDKHHMMFTMLQDLQGTIAMEIWTRGRKVTLRDSNRIFRRKLEKLPKLCGFEGVDDKQKMDYNIIRPVDHIKTVDERRYQIADVTILMRAMLWVRSFAPKGITVGGIAMNEFKRTLGKSPFKHLTADERVMMRSLYNGGEVVLPTHLLNKRITIPHGWVYDCNSMYPDKLRGELPIAIKQVHDTLPRILWSGAWAVHVIARNLTLKEGHFPLIITPYTGLARAVIPLLDKWFYTEEWYAIREDYNIESFDIVCAIEFETAVFGEEFVDKWYGIKRLNDERREFAKLVLNNVTGKLAENAIHEQIRREVVGSTYFNYRFNDIDDSNAWAFMPATARITSKSRLQLRETAYRVGMEHVFYCDTDSIHTDVQLPGDLISASELGKWKIESEFDEARYIKPKSYWESLNGKTTACKHAGVNDDATVAEIGDDGEYYDTGVLIGPENMMSGVMYMTNAHKCVYGGVAIVRKEKRM